MELARQTQTEMMVMPVPAFDRGGRRERAIIGQELPGRGGPDLRERVRAGRASQTGSVLRAAPDP
jgi:hypothetical protein